MKDKKTLLFFFLSFLIGAGFIFGFVSANSLLVGRMGTERLFDVYLMSGLFILPLWGLLYTLIDRFPRIKIFHSSYALCALIVAVCFGILRTNPSEAWIYLGIRVIFYAIYFLTLSQFWILTGQFFTYFEIKRRSPYFTVGDMLGQLTAGLSVSLLTKFINTVDLILLWAIIFLLCIAIVATLQKVGSNNSQSIISSKTREKPEISTTQTKWSTANLNLLIVLFLFWFTYSFLCYGTDYIYNTIAKQTLVTEDKLTSLFGLVASISAILLILYQTLFARLFIERLGLIGSVSAITLSMALSILLFKIIPNIYTIAVAEGVIYLILDFIASSRLNIVPNVFVDEQRGRVKIFAEGVGRSLGCVGVYVVSCITKSNIHAFAWVVSSIALANALVYPFLFHKAYVYHLMDSLKSSLNAHLTNVIQALGERYYTKATQPLLEILHKSNSAEIKQATVTSLGRIHNPAALQSLIDTFPSQDAGTQMGILKALTNYDSYEALFSVLKLTKYNPDLPIDRRLNSTILLTQWIGKKAMPHLIELLLDPSPRIKSNAIEAIAILKDHNTIPLLINFLKDENLRIRTNAAIALYPFKQCQTEIKQMINTSFNSNNDEIQRSGLYAIAMLKLENYREDLIKIINNPSSNKSTVLFAAFALGQMGDESFTDVFLPMLISNETNLTQEAFRLVKKLPSETLLLLLEKAEKLPTDQSSKIYTLLHQTLPYTSLIEKITWK